MSTTQINTNIASINAHRNLKRVNGGVFSASARLASGLRINSARDDAAGLAISEKMRSQIRGLEQAELNTRDGINMTRTMDGGMQGIQDMMTRVRELLVQALNDTNTADDRAKIQKEIDQLLDEIDQTAYRVEFNTRKLLCIPSEGYGVKGTTIDITMNPTQPFPTNIQGATVPNAAGWGYVYLPEGATVTIMVEVEKSMISSDWPDLVIHAPNGEKFGFGQNGFLGGGGQQLQLRM